MTVQGMMLRLAQAICPRTKDDTMFILSTICTIDGDLLTAQGFVDIYNEARTVLQSVIHPLAGKKSIEVSENVTQNSITFSAGLATKPVGLMETILLTRLVGTTTTIIPVVPVTEEEYILDKISPTNPAVVEENGQYRDPSLGSNMPDSTTEYKLRYVYVPQYTITDVTGGTTVESFSERWHWVIIEIATAISNSLGEREVLALAQTLAQKVIAG